MNIWDWCNQSDFWEEEYQDQVVRASNVSDRPTFRKTVAEGWAAAEARMGKGWQTKYPNIASWKALVRSLNLREFDIPDRLLRNVRQHRSREVRYESLAILLNHYRDRDEATAAIEDGCVDADPEIRLVAALQKGEEGVETLRALAETVTAAPHVGAAALRKLVERFPNGQSGRVLEHCLQRRVDLDVLLAAIEGVGALRYRPAAESLVALLDRVFDVETEKKITWALSRIGGGVAEGGLFRLLSRAEEETDLLLSVIEALGEVGTVAAVEALLPYAQAVLNRRGVKHTARTAIQRIQSRLRDAEAGRLSLAETHDAGALRLAEQPGGLSLAPPSQPAPPVIDEAGG